MKFTWEISAEAKRLGIMATVSWIERHTNLHQLGSFPWLPAWPFQLEHLSFELFASFRDLLAAMYFSFVIPFLLAVSGQECDQCEVRSKSLLQAALKAQRQDDLDLSQAYGIPRHDLTNLRVPLHTEIQTTNMYQYSRTRRWRKFQKVKTI